MWSIHSPHEHRASAHKQQHAGKRINKSVERCSFPNENSAFPPCLVRCPANGSPQKWNVHPMSGPERRRPTWHPRSWLAEIDRHECVRSKKDKARTQLRNRGRQQKKKSMRGLNSFCLFSKPWKRDTKINLFIVGWTSRGYRAGTTRVEGMLQFDRTAPKQLRLAYKSKRKCGSNHWTRTLSATGQLSHLALTTGIQLYSLADKKATFFGGF